VGKPLQVLRLGAGLDVGQRHPDHPVLVVAAPKGQLLPVPLLPLLVCMPVLLLHCPVGPVVVVVVVEEGAVHLLLLLGNMACLDPLLLLLCLPSQARNHCRDTPTSLVWGVLLRADLVRYCSSFLNTT
jgi:hypothetical protein